MEFLKKINLAMLAVFFGWSLLAHGGSVSGGGGGTLPGEPVEEKYIIDAISDSRALIDAFLKGIETFIIGDRGEHPKWYFHQFKKMFVGPTSVYEWMGTVKIEIRRNGACQDLDGKDVDGSIQSRRENGICISASRMREKLVFSNYEAEIAALILHELSHLKGATEEEAVAMQKIAVRFFAKKTSFDIGDWSFRVQGAISNLAKQTALTNDLLRSSGKFRCDQITDLAQSYSSLYELADAGSAMFLTEEKSTEFYWQLPSRLDAIRNYLCSQPNIGEDYQIEWAKQQIKKAFNGEAKVSTYEYDKRTSSYPYLYNRFPLVTLWIPNFNSVTEASEELSKTVKDLRSLAETLHTNWHLTFLSEVNG